jgi:uncharacterized membrane protein
MHRGLCGLVALGFLVSGVGHAKADYLFTVLPDVPGAMNDSISFTGINNAGQIVGSYLDANENEHGFLLSGGKYTSFDVPRSLIPSPGVVGTYPTAINDFGQIIGWAVVNSKPPPSGQDVGFLFNISAGTYTAIVAKNPLSTYTSTVPNGINNAGQIVGGYADERGSIHGFLLNGGTYTTIDVPGSVNGSFTTIRAINNAGQMLVDSSLGSFLLSGGTYNPLMVPGGAAALGLNDADEIVGMALDQTYGFVLNDSVLTTFRVPGSMFMQAWAINDSGQILGAFLDDAGREHGFLATPVSVPSNVVLLVVGILALIAWMCRWKRFNACLSPFSTPAWLFSRRAGVLPRDPTAPGTGSRQC